MNGVSPRASLAALVASVLAIATSLIPLVTHYADVAHVLGDVPAAAIVVLGAVAIAAACVCAAGNSILQLFPPKAGHDIAAALSITGEFAGGVFHPMTLLQEIGAGEQILGDVAAFAAGQPVNGSAVIGGKKVNVAVVNLGTTPPAADSGYTVFTGGWLQSLITGITLGSEVAAGAPVKVAEKIGNTWYGETVTIAPA